MKKEVKICKIHVENLLKSGMTTLNRGNGQISNAYVTSFFLPIAI